MESIFSTLIITKTLYDIISGIKNGPDCVHKTAESILHFHNLLQRVRELCARNPGCVDSAALLTLVKGSATDINHFASKVEKLQATNGQNAAGRLWKKLRIIINETDLADITLKISQYSA